MTQIETVKKQLVELRKKLNDGKIYQSLGSEIGNVIDNVKKIKLAKVYLSTDDDQYLETLNDLRTQNHEQQLTEISDEELILMLSHLGSMNPNVRDQGVYFFFSELLELQVLSKKQLVLSFNYLSQDDVMFSHILEPKNNAIFKRSFSLLLLSTILYGDQAGYFFLDSEQLNEFVIQFATYIILETDTRGFIKSNGWAHAYTHIGNVIDELCKRDDLSRADKLFFMTVLLERYKRLETPIIFGESQRIVAFLSSLANKNELYSNYLLLQLKSWRSYLMTKFQPQTEADWNIVFNHSRLMQTMLVRDDFPDEIMKYISTGENLLS